MRAIVLSAACLLFFSGTVFSSDKVSPPLKGQVKRGLYLVTLAGCNDCHSPKVMTSKGPRVDDKRRLAGYWAEEKLPEVPPGIIAPDKWGGLFSNDLTAWAGPWGTSFAANLTPDKDTGLGLWTEDIFIRTIRTGKHMGAGDPILPPMPWQEFAQMTDADLKAVFAYVRSLPPVKNRVPQSQTSGQQRVMKP